VRTIRLYDASRTPHDWMDIIQPGQFAVFASSIEGGAPRGPDGLPTTHEGATCGIADTLADAEAFCRAQVESHPDVRFDVFDSAGRAGSPLVTVVHPSRATSLEGHPGSQRRNTWIAIVLFAVAPFLFWWDWSTGGWMIVPTLAGFNALIFGGRLLQLNAAYAAAERRRLERVASSQPGASATNRP
jgi:hypothetical protein